MPRPIKVGIFNELHPGVTGSGGIPIHTRALATGLVGLGHEVHVLTSAPAGQAGQTLLLEDSTWARPG